MVRFHVSYGRYHGDSVNAVVIVVLIIVVRTAATVVVLDRIHDILVVYIIIMITR